MKTGLQIGIAAALIAAAGFVRADDVPPGMGDMLKDMTKGLTETNAMRRVPSAALKPLLPANPAGMRLVSATDGTEQVLAASISTARGRYSGAGDATLQIEIANWEAETRIAWTRMGLDAPRGETDKKKTDPGAQRTKHSTKRSAKGAPNTEQTESRNYDRTTQIQSWPAVERYNEAQQEAQVIIRVADRFIVSLSAKRLSDSDLKTAVQSLNLTKLAALRPE